jgi:hypothetical protein
MCIHCVLGLPAETMGVAGGEVMGVLVEKGAGEVLLMRHG